MSEVTIRDAIPRDRTYPVTRATIVARVVALLSILIALFMAQSAVSQPPPEESAVDEHGRAYWQRGYGYDARLDQAGLFEELAKRAVRDFELGRAPRSAEELNDLHSYYGPDVASYVAELADVYEQAYLEAKRADAKRTSILWVAGIGFALLLVVTSNWVLWRRFGLRHRAAETGSKASEATPGDRPTHLPRVIQIGRGARIATVRLRRIRGFEDFELSFMDASGSPRTATLVIGKNGTNKSTLLRCIALGLADRADATSLISKPIGALVSESADSGEIEIILRAEHGEIHTIKKRIRSSKGKEYIESEPLDAPFYELFVCAYGAGRAGAGTDPGRKYRILDSVLTLFDYGASLIDTELTLRRLEDTLSKKQYEATKAGLKRVLNLAEKDDLRPASGGGVEVLESSLGEPVRLESWADGYRLTLSWLLDLYGWAMRAGQVDRGGRSTAGVSPTA